MKRPLYIFDLDGTLANCQHRVPILDLTSQQNRWRMFYAACVDDTPIPAVINVADALWDAGADIWVFSGRSEEVRAQTQQWLIDHVSFNVLTEQVVMRREGDYRADDVVKQEMLDNMLPEDRERLVAVFDDRDRVVAMWRRNGIQCFQVAPGDF